MLLLSEKSGLMKFITEEMSLTKQHNFKIVGSLIQYSLLSYFWKICSLNPGDQNTPSDDVISTYLLSQQDLHPLFSDEPTE